MKNIIEFIAEIVVVSFLTLAWTFILLLMLEQPVFGGVLAAALLIIWAIRRVLTKHREGRYK